MNSVPATERLRRINALLALGLGLPPSQRDAWLGSLPHHEQSLVGILRALLARAEVETDTFMRHPMPVTWDDVWQADAHADSPGDVVGPYRLIEELGSGGMATVWLAQRTDGVMLRQVALKLPRLGWDAGLAQRMARERDILGTLEHPRIARLYDAGVSAEGRPWLAMERVDGVAIDVHCTDRALSVRERLALVLQVADAVAHAHARLVVHRDLKPSNILVTAAGDVKLLDFGVAKLIASESAADPGLTQAMGLAATPDYASPEQVAGRPISVTSDVYSLGVVLYELLAGHRPYKLRRTSTAALEEAILAADVPLPSQREGVDKAVARQLRGDLDAILIKALRKDPAARYPSVEAFANDLRRHLEGEVVWAKPPSRRYRVAKFVRRHRAIVSASTAVAIAVLAGLALALWQAREAREQADRAERVKGFIASIFRQATPKDGAGGVVTAADLLAAAGDRIERELADQPAVAAELGVMVGEGFSALGVPEQGAPVLRAAVARAQRLHGRRHPLVLRGKAFLADAIDNQDLPGAESVLAELVPDALAGVPATAEIAIEALQLQSFVLAKRDREEPSYEALRRAIELAEQTYGPLHEGAITAMGLLSNTYGRFGRNARQLETATEAVFRARAVWAARRPAVLLSQAERWYADALRANGRPADAAAELRRVLHDQRELDAAETPRVRNAILQLAAALNSAGQTAEALALMRHAVALESSQNPAESDDRAAYLGHLVAVLQTARRVDEAAAMDQTLQAVMGRLGHAPGAVAHASSIRRARIHAMRGDFAAALREANQVLVRSPESDSRWRGEAWQTLAYIHRLQGRSMEALSLVARARDASKAEAARLASQASLDTEEALAKLDLGQTDDAYELLSRALARYRQAQVDVSPLTHDAVIGWARIQLQRGQSSKALAELKPLVQAWETAHPGSPWHGEALWWLARAEALRSVPGASEHQQAAVNMLRASALPHLRRLSGARISS